MKKLEPELKLLFIAGLVYLLSVKSFWDDLQQNNNDFYPDGLDQCPSETYTLNDAEKTRCISCPQCPPGMEPTPSCGAVLAAKLISECVPCRSGTFSAETGSTVCKTCPDCGSRKIVTSCTTERDAESKECPWSHFKDQMTHTCKHCSFCCGINATAHLRCILSKKCKGNCSQTAKSTRKFTKPHSIFRRVVTKFMHKAQTATPVRNFNTGQENQQERSILLEKRGIEQPTLSEIIKTDINEKVSNREDTMGSNNKETEIIYNLSVSKGQNGKENEDLQSFIRPDISGSTQAQTNGIPTIQPDNTSYNFIRNDPKNNIDDAVQTEGRPISTTVKPTVSPSMPSKVHLKQLMPPTQVPTQMSLVASTIVMQQHPLINISSFLGSFLGTIAAFGVIGCIGIIAYIIFRKCTRGPSGYKELSGTGSLWEHQIKDDSIDAASSEDEMENSANETDSEITYPDNTTIMEDFNLLDIPPDLENILVQELDVTHGRGKNEVYGWQKVGKEAGIPRRELKYYQNEYLRPNGSPTKLLLEKLGIQGKTISYLFDVLQNSRVQLGNVAASIRHRVPRV